MTAACLVLALAAACLGLGLAAATGTDLGGDVTAIALPETIDGVPQREAKRERE